MHQLCFVANIEAVPHRSV